MTGEAERGIGLFYQMTAFSPTLRVMSFNVRCSHTNDGENAWPRRRELLAETIRTFDPDLLGLQEVCPDQATYLRTELPGYQAVGGGRDDGREEGEASPVLFRQERFALLEDGQFWLSETPAVIGSIGWDAALPRICTWARLRDKTTDHALLHLNTHWDHQGVVARHESAKLINAQIRKIAGNDWVVLTGDFNLYEDSEAFRTLVGAHTEPAQLVDGYRQLHPQREPNEASFHRFKGTVEGSRIDWILHSKRFVVKSAEIMRTSQERRHPSDHYPVTAELSYE